MIELPGGSVQITESEFREDPVKWARRADDVPRVAVMADDGTRLRFVIIQQRESLE